MKSYPSIKQFRKDRHANFVGHTFAKIDGSNLRFEWDRKKGWFRFGSRRRLLEETHAEFGIAFEIFRNGFADEFTKLAVDSGWESIMVFCEFWGAKSFAGQHEEADSKFLTPIDVAIYKKGLLSPSEFVQQFESKFDIGYLGTQTWDKQFVQSVVDSTLPGMAFEGVIGKNGSGHKRLALKLKSQAWKAKSSAEVRRGRGAKTDRQLMSIITSHAIFQRVRTPSLWEGRRLVASRHFAGEGELL